MNGSSNVEIRTNKGKTRVYFSGEDISNIVTGIQYEVEAGKLPKLTISILPDNIKIESDAVIELIRKNLRKEDDNYDSNQV